MRQQCCECRKVKQADGTWKHEIEQIVDEISHGYCDVCGAKAKKEVREFRRLRQQLNPERQKETVMEPSHSWREVKVDGKRVWKCKWCKVVLPKDGTTPPPCLPLKDRINLDPSATSRA